MLFQTPEFALLLTVTLLLYFGPLRQFRLAVLGAASLAFYAWTGPLETILLLVVLTLVYLLTTRIKPGGARWPVALSLVIALGNLVFFKYSAFLYDNLSRAASLVHLVLPAHRFTVLLPLGISFYTFELVAYVLDLYHGKTQPAKGFLQFFVFVTFFGHMLAGPIMRGSEFLPQLERLAPPSTGRIRAAGGHILLGLVKKVLIADALAAMADARFANAATLDASGAWIAAYLFAFQIYFDFSGYSDMAVGLGHLFGLTLTENFRTPYLSKNPSEFWRRWHVSLSSWLRDYVYIPLGGSRVPLALVYVNLMLTMVVGGLWHGAAWTFVLWGALQGIGLAGHRAFTAATARLHAPSRANLPTAQARGLWSSAGALLSMFLNFQFISLGWILFRASSLSTAWTMISRALDLRAIPSTIAAHASDLALVAVLFVLHWVEHLFRDTEAGRWWHSVPAPLRGLGYSVVVFALLVSMKSNLRSFIYFRF